MCGIIGFLDKTGKHSDAFGRMMLGMLRSLGCRGPDSAGVAIFGEASSDWILHIKLDDDGETAVATELVQTAAARCGPVLDVRATNACLRLVVAESADSDELCDVVESAAAGVEVISFGRRLEILKQVGSPDALEATYRISEMAGTHGIGHTRLSTESRVDLSHSQPFWARGLPDVATVHNGHITNYHKLRRHYEQRGFRFTTENDSEVIGVYLRDQIERGRTFEQALRQSLDDFDGSFTYLAASAGALAFVKDRFGFKPLVVAESDEFVALATEEIALRQTFSGSFRTAEPPPGAVRIWEVRQPVPVEP